MPRSNYVRRRVSGHLPLAGSALLALSAALVWAGHAGAASEVVSATGITGPTKQATYAFHQKRFNSYVKKHTQPLTRENLKAALKTRATEVLFDKKNKVAVVVDDYASIERETIEFLRHCKETLGCRVVAVAKERRRQEDTYGGVVTDDIGRRFMLGGIKYVDGVLVHGADGRSDSIHKAIERDKYNHRWRESIIDRARQNPANERTKAIPVVSGYGNPMQPGTLAMIEEARLLNPEAGTVVVVNNDRQVYMKKKNSMTRPGDQEIMRPSQDREAIVKAFSSVAQVVSSIDRDRTVVETLGSIADKNPVLFCNGGDRRPDDDPIPETVLVQTHPGRFDVRYKTGQSIEELLIEKGIACERAGKAVKLSSASSINERLGLEEPKER